MGPNEGGRGRDSLKLFRALHFAFSWTLIIASWPRHGLNLRTMRVELGWPWGQQGKPVAPSGEKARTRLDAESLNRGRCRLDPQPMWRGPRGLVRVA